MRNALAFIVYIAIGIGVVIAYAENHRKPLPVANGAFLVCALVWPAFVAADAYRAIGPKDSAGE